MAIKTKMFSDNTDTYGGSVSAQEQMERFCNRESRIKKEQIVSVSFSSSNNGNTRILLVYDDGKSQLLGN